MPVFTVPKSRLLRDCTLDTILLPYLLITNYVIEITWLPNSAFTSQIAQKFTGNLEMCKHLDLRSAIGSPSTWPPSSESVEMILFAMHLCTLGLPTGFLGNNHNGETCRRLWPVSLPPFPQLFLVLMKILGLCNISPSREAWYARHGIQ